MMWANMVAKRLLTALDAFDSIACERVGASAAARQQKEACELRTGSLEYEGLIAVM